MVAFSPFIWSNRNGIPRLEATSVDITSSAVIFNFNPHRFLNTNWAGLILFKLPSYTAPATPVPIIFNTNGTSKDVDTLGGTAVTSAELNKSGIYLAYYDGVNLQLLTGI